MLVGKVYHKEMYNCATIVCEYFRENGLGDLPDGNLEEYTHNALLWIKNNFKRISELKKHCLVLNKNTDGTLHVGVFDGKYILHGSQSTGYKVVREPLHSFFQQNKNVHIYEWRERCQN